MVSYFGDISLLTKKIAVFKYLDSNSAESSGKSVIVACSSDRGLCGAIHSSISKPVKIKCRDDPENTVVVAIGDKSRAQIARTARNQIVRSFNGVSSIPTFAEASKIASLVMNSDFEIGNIGIYYNKFQSVIAYEMTIIPAYTANNISSSGTLKFCSFLPITHYADSIVLFRTIGPV